MAFIAVNAKADITVENRDNPTSTLKKGKLTPAQNAQVNAWTLSKKTGIFNTLGKCLASANLPINNKVTVTFDDGYFVVCGRLVQVEKNTTVDVYLTSNSQANGVILSQGTSVRGKIVARFKLDASQESEFQVYATTGTLIEQDLNSNTSGTFDFVLYEYTAYADSLVLDKRNDNVYIDDVGNTLNNLIKGLENGSKVVAKADKSKNYDEAEGTIKTKFDAIETRLTNLGFKKASIQVLDSNYIDAEKTELYSLGKVIYGRIGYKSPNAGPTTGTIAEVNKAVAKITNLTLPYDDVEISISYPFSYAGREQTRYGNITVKTNGDIVIFRPSASGNVGSNISYASTSGEKIVLCDNFQKKTFTGE